jgi:hypothetical protein
VLKAKCVSEGAVWFFPWSGCQQAQFVLRHLAQRQQCWGGSNKRRWIAFIDLKGAYDHVDREALWHHLQHAIFVPPQLLTVIQSMYSDDAYRLVDGLTSTAPISPFKGDKQGCPICPILFALFLSNVGAALGMRHSTGRIGVPLQNVERGQSGVWHVTHLLFANDLAVVDTSQKRLQSQMHSLLRYANGKGLTVNVSKCAVFGDWDARNGGHGTIWQRQHALCRGVLLLGHVDEQDYEYVVRWPAHVWQHAGCLAASSASSQ